VGGQSIGIVGRVRNFVAPPSRRLAEYRQFSVNPATMTFDPAVWVLHDGKAGMASQAIGLAEATGFSFIEKPLAVRFPWTHLPPHLWLLPFRAVRNAGAGLMPPWPDLVIACGRMAALPALAIRRVNGGRSLAAQIQDPGIGHRDFDLLVVPEHDRLRGRRVFVTRGAVHRVTAARLAAARCRFAALTAMPRPIVSVLIGGSTRVHRLHLQRLGEIADALAGILRRDGGSLLVTTSRRTGEAGLVLLREKLAHLSAAIWDGTGENPYFAYLAFADALLVTADSISMVSEAAATGKPVHIAELDGGNAKFARFHATMRAAGITRPFRGRIESWSYPIPDDTARAGAALRALVVQRFA
jgi:mitochondrial fission protein ELM1